MFPKGNSYEKTSKEIETIIGPSVKVEGDFSGEGNVVVEGVVNGTLKTKQNLTVGEHAKISADVEAINAEISGQVKGNIKAKEKLELTNTAKIFGDIEAKILIVKAGAIFNGKCNMTEEKKILAEKSK
ncbi:MAG: cell shape determination protein CcmA [Parcubacteria group bacterium CG23_combo_of_CG06-09_8_20_14_all_35_9]|nr:MAG: cell shape determination protein CcmA [Parcubacteria group bacterium CG23_combo_of_CG06-09_8_20_14_all_35_9]